MAVKTAATAGPGSPPAPVPTTVAVRLAGASGRATSSAIRDLLAVTERPEVISLAGGLPAPEGFPAAALADAATALLEGDPAGSLQYAPTSGFAPLRAWVAGRLPGDVADGDVVVTHGSQQALELVARALVDPGDEVALADPAYIGALQVLRLAGARLLGVPSDADGMRVDVLADRLAAGARPALVYVVADFDNPTGATLSGERRRALAGLADRYGFVLVADDPYGDLCWAGARPPALATLTDRVVTLGTVSKILAPGLRVGWAACPAGLATTLVTLKQAADLQTTTFTQRLAHHVLARPGFLDAHLAGLRARYSTQARALAGALRDGLGDRVAFAEPDGGMFLWCRIDGIDSRALLPRAIAAGTAFVPGPEFAVDPATARPEELRLSYATASPAQLAVAVDRLVAALRS